MSYFTISELTRSATAAREGIDNTPPQSAVDNMKRLINTVLNPARQQLKAPIHVNSGYRCPELNRRVGGALRSYHLQGRAADLTTRPNRNAELMAILRQLPHTELINEGNGTWIHVAL